MVLPNYVQPIYPAS